MRKATKNDISLIKEILTKSFEENKSAILAATARKDYTDRRRRQADGVLKAKDEGRYKGRPENVICIKRFRVY